MAWVPPEADDVYYASLPWPEAQAVFFMPPGNPGRTGMCGWHGTSVDPQQGAVALVRTDGPLADLVGDRVRVSRVDKNASVYVYVYGQAQVVEDISLTRRAFASIASLWMEELEVTLEVLGG